jgi:hypothetical protein
MPTFIIFHAGQPVETIRGANPPALTAAITKAIALPEKANAGSAFQKPGRTLGGEGVGSQTTAPARGGASSGLGFGFMDVLKHIIPILGIYFVSLFAVRWLLFGLPPGGIKVLLTDWFPTSVDRLLHPSPTFIIQRGEPAPTATGT